MTFAKIRLGFGAAVAATLIAGAALAQDGITGLAVVGAPA